MNPRLGSMEGRGPSPAAAALGIALLVAVAGCFHAAEKHPGPRGLDEEDRLARQDDVGELGDDRPPDSPLFPDTETGRLLEHHMEVLTLPAETIEEADRRYGDSLDRLRANEREAVELLARAYTELAEERYFERWGVIKAMADLESAYASLHLSEVATAPIPPEKSENLHHFSTQEQEVMIRLRAVEGLRALAIEGDDHAEQVLWRTAVDDATPAAVRVRAIKAYLGAGGPDDVARRETELKKHLPKKLHGVVTLEVTPQDVFIRRVNENLARIEAEGTAGDGAEERLPDEEAPGAEPPYEE